MTEEKPKTVVFILMHDKNAELEEAWRLLPSEMNPEGFWKYAEAERQLRIAIADLRDGRIGRLIVVTSGYMVDDRTRQYGDPLTHHCCSLGVLTNLHPKAHFINLCSHGVLPLENSLSAERVLEEVNAVLAAEAAA